MFLFSASSCLCPQCHHVSVLSIIMSLLLTSSRLCPQCHHVSVLSIIMSLPLASSHLCPQCHHVSVLSIIMSLAPATQQLLVLLFGTWFRIVNHAEFNTMSSEAVAKSVAGSLFHTCADDPQKIEKAVQASAPYFLLMPVTITERFH